MEAMTPEQREAFVGQRVRDILKAFEDFHHDIATLTQDERDKYIQSRAVRDLAITDAITLKLKSYVSLRDLTWQWITFVDIIALIAFIGLALRDFKDVLAFAVIALVMGASRLLNHNLLKNLHALLELYEAHTYRESDTAALLFLINGVKIVESVKIMGDDPAKAV